MKAAVLYPEPLTLTRSRLLDYVALTKPRIAALVLFTVAAGVLLAAGGAVPLPLLVHTVLGTALVASGASALNQLLERHRDARMSRTENRPLPAGRLTPVEVLIFGLLLGLGGTAYLLLALPHPCAAILAAVSFLCYVGIYTPLKPYTSLNTLVGAVPGALPPVIGWAAVSGAITPGAVVLFAILFLWQVPHFLAIAWIYRAEYARAGMCMLPVLDPHGVRTGQRMIAFCLALVPASLGPVLLGSAGLIYLGGAVLLGLYFLAGAVAFRRSRTQRQARRVLRISLFYLPALLLLLLLDGAVYRLVLAP
jgi:protoheme IX farnesyltransferase